MEEGTEVKCTVCSNIWTTRAKRKAICTNKDCKSTKVVITATGEKYNAKSSFIEDREKQKAERVREPYEELKAEFEEEDTKSKTVSEKDFKVLFEKDGKTPKATADGMKDIFKGLPKPSPVLVSTIQNISAIPARLFGAHWLMSQEEAEIIASAAIPIFKELGLRIDKISPRFLFIGAIAIYVIPRLVQTVLRKRAINKGESPPDLDSVTQAEVGNPESQYEEMIKGAQGIGNKSAVREAVDDQVRDFQKKYKESLDEFGNDKFAERRSIKKPKNKR